MPTKSKNSLGRALVRDLNRRRQPKYRDQRQTVQEAALVSATEERDLEAFFRDAQMEGRRFDAERYNVKIVDKFSNSRMTAPVECDLEIGDALTVPRRPEWNKDMCPEELHQQEVNAYNQWRKNLSLLEQASKECVLTPYEKNIDIWRQLWRVIEKSDIVVQILDSRNPLLFRCKDLEDYVKSFEKKSNAILLNKADLLDEEQRLNWRDYFTKEEADVTVILYSASCVDQNLDGVWTDKDLLGWMERQRAGPEGKSSFGLVGYPNVGKSSTINSLLQTKKVAVSATPGKTKHFQTINLTENVTLYDCPGLVFPAYGLSRGELIVNGILSVDQMRDCIGPLTIICQRLSKSILSQKYSLNLPKWRHGEHTSNARHLAEQLAESHSFMSHKGIPDISRAARMLIKDYIAGTLLYVYPPPGYEEVTNDDGDEAEDSEIDLEEKALIEKLYKAEFAESDRTMKCLTLNRNGINYRPDHKKHFKSNRHVKARIKFAHLDA